MWAFFFKSFRYNKLLEVICLSLRDTVKALKGSVVMSSALELMARSLFNNAVPDMWQGKAHTAVTLHVTHFVAGAAHVNVFSFFLSVVILFSFFFFKFLFH